MSSKVSVIDQYLANQAQACLAKLSRVEPASNRLQAIISAYHYGVKKVCEVLGVSRMSIYRWTIKFCQEGVEGLYNAGKPSRSKLNEAQ